MNEDMKPCFKRTASGSVEPAQLREPFTLATHLSHKAAREDRPHFSLVSPLPCELQTPLLCCHLRGVCAWQREAPWLWLAYGPALGGDRGPGLQMSACSLPYFSDLRSHLGPTGGVGSLSVLVTFYELFLTCTRGGSGQVGRLWGRSGLLGPSLLPMSSAQASTAAFPASGAPCAGAALPSLSFSFSIYESTVFLGLWSAFWICGSKPSPSHPPFCGPLQACIFFFFFNLFGWAHLSCDMWDPIPRPGIEPGPPALGAWSLIIWTTRAVSKPA